ncbi:uncharacterized protein EI90DRAFT_3063906 [Cantharellus anzutake]|uniref:uncharacterized protein n=1 Tax=Cantharellus anzutake TaxID=1750568 RepID=UPI0019081D41|nr:uncharacterized protein EI90DRAFT_3063906 [Cantharellus anzutake]KAF8328887.1 hypothetical protein EI90DRAFT_3063906 [Cantharellus anzutake]
MFHSGLLPSRSAPRYGLMRHFDGRALPQPELEPPSALCVLRARSCVVALISMSVVTGTPRSSAEGLAADRSPSYSSSIHQESLLWFLILSRFQISVVVARSRLHINSIGLLLCTADESLILNSMAWEVTTNGFTFSLCCVLMSLLLASIFYCARIHYPGCCYIFQWPTQFGVFCLSGAFMSE